MLSWSLRRSFARHVGLASSSVSSLRRGRNLTERYRTLENNTSTPRTHASALPQVAGSAAGLQADRPVRVQTSDPRCVHRAYVRARVFLVFPLPSLASRPEGVRAVLHRGSLGDYSMQHMHCLAR